MTNVAVARRPETCTDDLIVGRSAPVALLKSMIGRVAGASASVMIAGPSGSGKEVVARAIHAASPRRDKPFVAINCGAIPAELIESELFGHERGAFTGAAARRVGRFEEADGGTLFLDEIGDMRFDMQVKLLRVLEDGIVTRVGGNGAIPVDVRVICATHRNMQEAIADGRFREDLYYRLGVVPVSVPDLACRAEDIPLLISHFQNRKNRDRGLSRFGAEAIERLKAHGWPGNVRELRNVVERADVLFPGETIDVRQVEILLGIAPLAPARIADIIPFPVGSDSTPVAATPTIDPLLEALADRIPINLKALLETMELERIQMALDLADGVISEAARLLTLKRTTLIEKMRKYGVDRVA